MYPVTHVLVFSGKQMIGRNPKMACLCTKSRLVETLRAYDQLRHKKRGAKAGVCAPMAATADMGNVQPEGVDLNDLPMDCFVVRAGDATLRQHEPQPMRLRPVHGLVLALLHRRLTGRCCPAGDL